MAIKPEFEQVKYGDDIDAIKWNSNFKEILDYVEDISEELMLKVNTINSQLSSNVLSNLRSIYPIGSLYIGTTNTCPIANLFGTWEKIEEGLCLQSVKGDQVVGTTVKAGLPPITGTIKASNIWAGTAGASGCVSVADNGRHNAVGNGGSSGNTYTWTIDASKSNSIYGNSSTVQPPAYLVNIWKRTA